MEQKLTKRNKYQPKANPRNWHYREKQSGWNFTMYIYIFILSDTDASATMTIEEKRDNFLCLFLRIIAIPRLQPKDIEPLVHKEVPKNSSKAAT